MKSRPATDIVRLLWLLGVWLVLWSDLSIANIVSGLLVAGVVILTFEGWRAGTVAIRPIRAARFAGHFLYKLVESSVIVAQAVVAPRGRIHTSIVAVPLRGGSDAMLTLVADVVNLTPGTLVLEVGHDPPMLYLHALDGRDAAHLRRSVHRIEALAINAFGDPRMLNTDHHDSEHRDDIGSGR